MTTGLDALRCPSCKRILCTGCRLPLGAHLTFRCRDCKAVSEFEAVPGRPVMRLTESVQYVATVGRLTGR